MGSGSPYTCYECAVSPLQTQNQRGVFVLATGYLLNLPLLPLLVFTQAARAWCLLCAFEIEADLAEANRLQQTGVSQSVTRASDHSSAGTASLSASFTPVAANGAQAAVAQRQWKPNFYTRNFKWMKPSRILAVGLAVQLALFVYGAALWVEIPADEKNLHCYQQKSTLFFCAKLFEC